MLVQTNLVQGILYLFACSPCSPCSPCSQGTQLKEQYTDPYGKGKEESKVNPMVKFICPSAPVTVTEYVKRDPSL